MKALKPSRLKPSRKRRMNELSTLAKELRQIYEEFEDFKRARLRLAKRAKKLSNSVRKRMPDMSIASDADLTLHTVVDELAKELHLSDTPYDRELSDDTLHTAARSFDDVFLLLKLLSDVPWLKA